MPNYSGYSAAGSNVPAPKPLLSPTNVGTTLPRAKPTGAKATAPPQGSRPVNSDV